MRNRQKRLDQFVARVERGEVEALKTEGDRVAAVRALGAVPDAVGPRVPAAVARGPVRMVSMLAAYPDGPDKFKFRPAGAFGRKTLQIADTFDLMARRAVASGGREPFSVSQVAMGRLYRDLVERHECAGIKCSSIEGRSGGGGSGGGIMDAVLRDRQAIRALRGLMGEELALDVGPIPKARRRGRRSVPVRDLVDMVCLWDATITDVLRSYGWPVNGRNRAALTKAAGKALDRMAGPMRRARTAFASEFSRSIWDAADSWDPADSGPDPE